MVSLLMILATALLVTLLLIFMPADFRKSFFNPETFGERLLVKSLGIVAIATMVAEIVVGHTGVVIPGWPDNGVQGWRYLYQGISPCVGFGMYASFVLYVRAVFFLRQRQAHKRAFSADAAQM